MKRRLGLGLALALACCSLLLPHAARGRSLPLAARAEQLRQAQVVIVTGSADHMEQVMTRANVKFVLVDPSELPQIELHGQQVLMVNCTGQMSDAARERVRRFVNAGGLLYTTDHAVHFLLESIFPGFIKYEGVTSTAETFPMETSGDQGLLRNIGTAGHPQWQLAGGGFLFKVVAPKKVEVLMRSKEVGARYGTPVLGVRFHVGDGQVVHVTGHFFTQPGQRPEVAAAGRAFEQLSANVVREKKADNSRIDGLYNVVPKRPAVMREAPAPEAAPVASLQDIAGGDARSGAKKSDKSGGVTATPASKLHVLEREGGYARVRDTSGNEGWIDESAL
jgi:hypothetical protein